MVACRAENITVTRVGSAFSSLQRLRREAARTGHTGTRERWVQLCGNVNVDINASIYGSIMCTLRAVPAVCLGQRAELKGTGIPTVHASGSSKSWNSLLDHLKHAREIALPLAPTRALTASRTWLSGLEPMRRQICWCLLVYQGDWIRESLDLRVWEWEEVE